MPASRHYYTTHLPTLFRANQRYRQALHTIPEHVQVVIQTLVPGETIECESHPHWAQSFIIMDGKGEIKVNRTHIPVRKGSYVLIHPNETHCVRNTSSKDNLQLFIQYSRQDQPVNYHKDRQGTPETD